MLIVASEIDENTDRIINYLSDYYGIGINAISFQYFCVDGGKEYLARVFLIEPSEVDRKSDTSRTSKRKPSLTLDDFKKIAEENGVEELFDKMVSETTKSFDHRSTTRSTVSWVGVMGKSKNTILNVLPQESNAEIGLRFYIYIERLTNYLNTSLESIKNILPANIEERNVWNVDSPAIFGYLKNVDEVVKFTDGLKALKK